MPADAYARQIASQPRTETLGTRLRRLAKDAQAVGNCWELNRGYMRALRPWQPSTAYLTYQMVVNGGNIYVCVSPGTSAASGGPTITSSGAATDNTALWTYWGTNYVTADSYVTQAAWAATTAYTLGTQVINGGKVYACVVAGTSAGAGGPTTTTNAIVDNTVTWTYMGVFVAGKYAQTSPTFTTSASPIAGLNYYKPASGQLLSAQWANPLFTGSGYAVNDTVTLATGNGTVTTATVIKITAVNNSVVFTVSGVTVTPTAGATYTNNGVTFTVVSASITTGSGTVTCFASGVSASSGALTKTTGTGDATVTFASATTAMGVPKACTVQTAGLYSALQSNNNFWSQGSTSGAGTGGTFTVAYNAPGWCNLYGAYQSSASSLFSRSVTFYPAAQSAPTAQDWMMEFYTDSVNVQFNGISSGAPAAFLVVIDGVTYCPDLTTGVTTANQYWNFNFANNGGRKKRLFQLYIHSSGPYIPFVQVDNVATVWRPDRQDVITCATFSDSIWAGSSYGPFVPGNSVPLRLGLELGWRNVYSFNQGGTGWLTGGAAPGVTTGTFQDRIPQALAMNPDLWMFMGSTNDIGLGDCTATVTAALQSIRAGGSTAPIIVLGLWCVNSAGVATTEAQVAAGVAAFNDPLGKTFFIPVYNDPFLPWITGSWNNNPAPSGITNTGAQNATAYINAGDNIHPPDPGTEYLAKRIAQAVMTNVLPVIK